MLKHYQLKSHSSPIGHGWHLVNGLSLPVRSTQPPLPPSMPLSPKPLTEMLSDDRSDSEDSDCDSCTAVVHTVIVNPAVIVKHQISILRTVISQAAR